MEDADAIDPSARLYVVGFSGIHGWHWTSATASSVALTGVANKCLRELQFSM